ncbi:DNA polymerase delta small subunit-like [Phaseolus vulgaris]|uniref:DNA polymerase delta small subunit-like n=1 Tax=Phaseolus vulgaris TaxID=3885 RepID=UPI0035CBF71B
MWYVSDFLVQDVLDAGLPPQIEFPLKSGEDKYVLLVSGLRVGSSTSNSLWFQLLIDHITTHLGDEKDFAKVSETIRKLDILLSQIATGLPLDIMPGHSDPANFSLHNSHCMDAFSLGLLHIILLALVQILIVLSLIMSGFLGHRVKM